MYRLLVVIPWFPLVSVSITLTETRIPQHKPLLTVHLRVPDLITLKDKTLFKYLYNLVGFYVKPGTWNILEHSGTFRNNLEHRIIMIIMRKKCVQLNFGLARMTVWSAQIGHVTCFLFASRTTLLLNESVRRHFTLWEVNWIVFKVTDYWWYFEWRQECFNRVLPRKF